MGIPGVGLTRILTRFRGLHDVTHHAMLAGVVMDDPNHAGGPYFLYPNF